MAIGGKRIASSDMRGDKGIALIHRIVNDMGFVWNALHLEAGIDGIIEVRDPSTSEVTNCIIQVQSKAGPSYFKAESDTTFEFYCGERDLEYWLRGNAPVVLIVSRPDSDEAYWVPIKEYFRDPVRYKSRKVTFNKLANRLTVESRELLARLAMPVDSGTYLPALPCNETLASNLLPIVRYPKRFYRASTKLRFPSQVWDILNTDDVKPPAEWLLHSGMLYSFHDVTFAPLRRVCSASTAENLSSDQWSLSNDKDSRYVFSRMLKMCVSQLLGRHGVRYSKDKKHYYFRSTPDLKEKKIGGLSVFKGFESKTIEGRIAYYRHRAMDYRLVRFDGQWFAEITPSYHFTHDGYRPSRFFEERLRGIKQLERQNKTHLRQLRLWESVLRQTYLATGSEPDSPQQTLFGDEAAEPNNVIDPYTLIEFGELLQFSVDWGIPEGAWLPAGHVDESDDDSLQGRLFDS